MATVSRTTPTRPALRDAASACWCASPGSSSMRRAAMARCRATFSALSLLRVLSSLRAAPGRSHAVTSSGIAGPRSRWSWGGRADTRIVPVEAARGSRTRPPISGRTTIAAAETALFAVTTRTIGATASEGPVATRRAGRSPSRWRTESRPTERPVTRPVRTVTDGTVRRRSGPASPSRRNGRSHPAADEDRRPDGTAGHRPAVRRDQSPSRRNGRSPFRTGRSPSRRNGRSPSRCGRESPSRRNGRSHHPAADASHHPDGTAGRRSGPGGLPHGGTDGRHPAADENRPSDGTDGRHPAADENRPRGGTDGHRHGAPDDHHPAADENRPPGGMDDRRRERAATSHGGEGGRRRGGGHARSAAQIHAAPARDRGRRRGRPNAPRRVRDRSRRSLT